MRNRIDRTFSTARRIALAIGLGIAFAGAADAVETALDGAGAEYEVQHFTAALAAYESAAQAGDAQAQEIAGLMHLYGEALYGTQIAANRTKAVYWLAQAAGQGRETARYLVDRMAAREAATGR
ncbi:MAG: hypothetical protein ACK4V1_03890 [Burkholderiaceae bacterium]